MIQWYSATSTICSSSLWNRKTPKWIINKIREWSNTSLRAPTVVCGRKWRWHYQPPNRWSPQTNQIPIQLPVCICIYLCRIFLPHVLAHCIALFWSYLSFHIVRQLCWAWPRRLHQKQALCQTNQTTHSNARLLNSEWQFVWLWHESWVIVYFKNCSLAFIK